MAKPAVEGCDYPDHETLDLPMCNCLLDRATSGHLAFGYNYCWRLKASKNKLVVTIKDHKKDSNAMFFNERRFSKNHQRTVVY